MATRASKRRKVKSNEMSNGLPPPEERVFPTDASVPTTREDRLKWQGFCEIENDPAFFNTILQDFGVTGVKVHEVFGLDEALLCMLPKPVYGLIFLFRYKEDDFLETDAICPEHVWFANQTTGNACATVALLNIVMNIPDADLGPNLSSFKSFTRDFTPALRGDQIQNYDFVKNVHNSFARKIDMMNIDLKMQDDAKAVKAKTKAAKNASSSDDAAFHFIAFLPIAGSVWKLDGLDRQPQKLHDLEDDEDWLQSLAPNLQARMAQYEEGDIEFGLLSLVKDPRIELKQQLVQNIKSIQMCEERLTQIKPTWREFAMAGDSSEENLIVGPSSDYSIGAHDIRIATIPPSFEKRVKADDDPTTLIDARQKLVTEQAGLRAALRDEEQVAAADREKAESRRYDYGPFVQTWLRMLAESGTLRTLIEDVG
ncbi:ubiquitin carboxyl-terminal hydrolase [Phyllosticta citribraziliensis]|uniref:Ubiquitin carboxyl-terminal hydrolase n=1 Tax=Phyllosticta citribraziliensis TaxID=989973 RepID=A0ABR1L3Q4_9PEZI